MTLTPIERDAILAGLRLLQRQELLDEDIDAIASDSGQRLSPDAIDDLCERINR